MKLSALVFLLFVFQGLFSQSVHRQTVTSEVDAAIVYLDGAEVNRTKTVNLKRGRNELIFTGLSPKINSKTIQVNAPQGVDILSVSTRLDFLTLEQESDRIVQLRDSLALLQRRIVSLNDEKGAYAVEKELLLANKALGGNASGVAIADLKEAATYYRSRIMEINKNTSKLTDEITKLQVTVRNLSQQLNELNSGNTIQRSEVTVLVMAASDTKAAMNVRYLVNEVGWIPTYDIKANEINQPITLTYRAKVYNNSGIAWNNIQLTLSSADPNLSASKPQLEPWYLSYKRNDIAQNAYSQNAGQAPSSLREMDVQMDKAMESATLNTFQKGDLLFTNIAVSDINVEFSIPDKYSVPSDAKPYFIEVKEYQLKATFKHFTIPKQSCDAYLLARITGWEELDILEGMANIYLNGTFTGQSFIDTRNINDTLDISLGRDKKVQVQRKRQVEFNKEKSLGANKKELFAYQIVLKNNHKVPVEIEVMDQIPVPQDSDIEIVDLELADAVRNEINGALSWSKQLAPGTTETLDFSFSIKYPKHRPVNTKQNKIRSVRYF
jgi:uncharacterized protein (TIGR02231 family)